MSARYLAPTISNINPPILPTQVHNQLLHLVRSLSEWWLTKIRAELTSSFLILPFELRVHILRTALHRPDSTLALLQTCKQINMEAKPLLYERPIKLYCQAELFRWLNRSRTSNLERVRSLTLQLNDIDLLPLVEQKSSTTLPASDAWALYQRELAKLEAALIKLPNLTNLTVIPPERTHSQLLRGMFLSFLSLIPVHLPKLLLLIIHSDASIFESVPGLRGLAKVSFDSPSTAAIPASKESNKKCKGWIDELEGPYVVR